MCDDFAAKLLARRIHQLRALTESVNCQIADLMYTNYLVLTTNKTALMTLTTNKTASIMLITNKYNSYQHLLLQVLGGQLYSMVLTVCGSLTTAQLVNFIVELKSAYKCKVNIDGNTGCRIVSKQWQVV